MTTNGTRYDLVLFGSDLQGAERAQAVSRLAQWMKVAPDQSAQILEQRGLVIARGLDADTGKRCCTANSAPWSGSRKNRRNAWRSSGAANWKMRSASSWACRA